MSAVFWNLYKKSDLVCVPVNTVGVMGAGLAAAIRPLLSTKAWSEYVNVLCTCRPSLAGKSVISCDEKHIFCFTKHDWRNPSSEELVEGCLNDLIWLSDPTKTVLIPKLGCGLGSLEWEHVEPMFTEKIQQMKWKEVFLV